MNKAAFVKAASKLFSDVYIPVFFNRLREFGVAPRSDFEAQQLLKAGAEVREFAKSNLGELLAVPDEAVVKAASAYLKDNPELINVL